MQKELINFGTTSAKQTSNTKGGDVTSKTATAQTAKQSSSSSQKAKASACSSGGLIPTAGCLGAGAGLSHIIIITIIIFILFLGRKH
jgi:hypothetical protein